MKCCGLQPTERTGCVLRENPGAGLCDRISRARLVTCACPLPAFVRSSPSLCAGCVLPHPRACHMIVIVDSRIAISHPFRRTRRSATPAHVHPDPSSPTFFVEPSRLFLPTVVSSPQVYPQNADKRAAPFFEAGEIEGPGPGARRRRFACTYKRYLPRIVFVAHNHFRNASVRRVRLAGLPVGRPRAIPAHSYGTKTLQSAGKLQVMTSCRDSLLLVLLISAHFS